MSFLRLSGIGKIYISEGNVTVGIRGVNLAFDRGEFVAITGSSGSGKSTLLNVISGMDSYEEGELYIEELATSHYTEADWENYRSEYISFIFQDYNILESYTVLQNVELALMHITDRRARRARALELLRRVGMEKHLNQKGSKLSGGQKQRTVIARALAKDSPIILADEPTGNLDEATSKEIIDLLREVSRDKLLIVVTHNFEEVEHCATRHVRVYDGAIEFDRTLAPRAETEEREEEKSAPKKAGKLSSLIRTLRDGTALGGQVFLSRPHLAVFACLLMAVGMIGVFVMTSLCFTTEDFEKNYMFEPMDGRVIVVRRDRGVPDAEEIAEIAEKFGAESVIANDSVLDGEIYFGILHSPKKEISVEDALDQPAYGQELLNKKDPDTFYVGSNQFLCRTEPRAGETVGEYPDERNEVMLCLPIYEKPRYSEQDISNFYALHEGIYFKVVGITYYYDNNLSPVICFTDEGLELFAAYYAARNDGFSIRIKYGDRTTAEELEVFCKGELSPMEEYEVGVSTELGREIYISPYTGIYFVQSIRDQKYNMIIRTLNDSDMVFTPFKYLETESAVFNYDTTKLDQTITPFIVLGADLALELFGESNAMSYCQFSLFFDSDRTAERVARELTGSEYIAVPSTATVAESTSGMISRIISIAVMFLIWIATLAFFAFFIALCQNRSIATFKSDIAIMRSMGIPTAVIRLSMYVRTVISLIPAAILVAVVAVYIYRDPALNEIFTYLYPWQYALIGVGMFIMALLISKKQQSKLFTESVKKTLTGGVLND